MKDFEKLVNVLQEIGIDHRIITPEDTKQMNRINNDWSSEVEDITYVYLFNENYEVEERTFTMKFDADGVYFE